MLYVIILAKYIDHIIIIIFYRLMDHKCVSLFLGFLFFFFTLQYCIGFAMH